MFDIFRSEKRAIDALAIELADDIRAAYPLDQQAGTGAKSAQNAQPSIKFAPRRGISIQSANWTST